MRSIAGGRAPAPRTSCRFKEAFMLMQIGRRSSSALNRVTRPTSCNFTPETSEVITSENYSLQNLINPVYHAIFISYLKSRSYINTNVVFTFSRPPIYLKVIVSKAFSGYISRAGAGRSRPFFTHIAVKLITYTMHAASSNPCYVLITCFNNMC